MSDELTTTVWVIESGEYEQRAVFGVAASVAAAVAYVKSMYGHPYIVEWSDPEPRTWTAEGESRTVWSFTGRFEAVPNFSTSHTAVYDFTEWKVHALKEAQ